MPSLSGELRPGRSRQDRDRFGAQQPADIVAQRYSGWVAMTIRPSCQSAGFRALTSFTAGNALREIASEDKPS